MLWTRGLLRVEQALQKASARLLARCPTAQAFQPGSVCTIHCSDTYRSLHVFLRDSQVRDGFLSCFDHVCRMLIVGVCCTSGSPPQCMLAQVPNKIHSMPMSTDQGAAQYVGKNVNMPQRSTNTHTYLCAAQRHTSTWCCLSHTGMEKCQKHSITKQQTTH